MIKVLILRAPGINRDEDAAAAIEMAGGKPERVHVNRIVEGAARLHDYAMLVIPGGFSYGDHLGAGKLLAVDLAHRLQEQLAAFVADGRPVLGICNGFQVLVKAGILPHSENHELSTLPPPHPSPACGGRRREEVILGSPVLRFSGSEATLTDNASGQFECRWVHLAPDPQSACVFTKGLERTIEVPVAHGEGRFVVRDSETLIKLREHGQVALRYVAADGSPAAYPANPNGSDDNIAGICNPAGNVLGLMPHPEDAILHTQHPRWTREAWRKEGDGLAIFRNAVQYANKL